MTRPAEIDATITRVEMYLGWSLDEQQKEFLRSALGIRPGASPESLARLIVQQPCVTLPATEATR